MTYPPKFGTNLTYSSPLDLDKIPVFMERSGENPMFLEVTGLPQILTYGKHYGIISIKFPENSQYQLRNNSELKFEVKDSTGTVIFSELAVSEDTKDNYSGASIFYIWIKQDPLRTYTEIQDGVGTLTFVGELNGVPDEWKNRQNYRCVFPIEIRKELPNTSPILFQSSSLVSSSLQLSESIEVDDGEFRRSYIHISASNLQTFGGKLEFIELAYKEKRNKSDEFQVLNTYPLSSSIFEVETASKTGLNAISDFQKFPHPKDIRRFGEVEYRLRFLNKNLEYAKSLKQEDSIVSISSSLNITGSPLIVETDDNLITETGNLIFGEKLTDGFKLDFKKKGEGKFKSERTLEFTPIVDGVEQKGFAVAEQGGFINDISSNAITESGQASMIGSLSSSITKSVDASIIASKNGSIQFSPLSFIIGGQDHKIHHSESIANAGELTANGIIGGSINTISSSITGSDFIQNSYIVGGGRNALFQTSSVPIAHSVVIGGFQNQIHAGLMSTIVGGNLNTIKADFASTIGSVNCTVEHASSVILGMTSKTSTAADTVFVQNLDVAGNMTVNQLTASIVSSSIMFSSGSNIFGDAIVDTHTFNGHITASGNISASGDINAATATLGGFTIDALDATINRDLTIGRSLVHDGDTDTGVFFDTEKITATADSIVLDGNVTASGNISASGTTTTEDLIVKDNATVAGNLDISDTIYHTGDSNTKIRFPEVDTISFHTSGDEQMRISSGGHITASGNISSSGNLISQHITASGNISASGDLFVDDITADDVTIGDDVILTSANARIQNTSAQGSILWGSANSSIITFISGSSGTVTVPFYFDMKNQKMGVNTVSPGESLEVVGNISSSGFLHAKHLILSGGSGVFTSASLAAGSSGGGGGSMDNFTLTADGGSNQTIENGNTLDIAGGTNITTAVGATDTVTVNLDASPNLTNITASGNISASGTIIADSTNFGGQLTAQDIHFRDNKNQYSFMSSSGNFEDTSFKLHMGDIESEGNATKLIIDDSAAKFDFDGGFVEVGNYLDLTGTTAASSNDGDSGVLRVEGGASIAKNISTTRITASADISASGDINGNTYKHRDKPIIQELTLLGTANTIVFGDGTTARPSGILGTSLTIVPNITASGNISSSGTITGNGLSLDGAAAPFINFSGVPALAEVSNTILQLGVDNTWTKIQYGKQSTDQHQFTGDITASGNISSSGGVSVFGQVVHLEGTDPRLKLKAKGANHPGIEWHEDSTRKWVLYNDPDESDKLVFKNDSTELVKINQAGATEFPSHITASGDISASGTLHTFGGNVGIGTNALSDADLTINSTEISAPTPGVTLFQSINSSTSGLIISGGQAGGNPASVINTTGHVKLQIGEGGDTYVELIADRVDLKKDTNVTGHITASGNISASGKLVTKEVESLSDFTLDVEGDITFDANGADIILSDDGTDFGRFKRDSSDFIIKSETNNKDIVFRGQDGGATITALTLDMSEAGAATFNSHITASGNISASGDVESKTLNVNKGELTGSITTQGPFNIHYGNSSTATGSLSNGQGYGEIISIGIVHASCEAGHICYNTNNIWRGADADFVTAAGDVMLGVGLETGTGVQGPILVRGVARLQAGHIADTSGQNGDALYLSTEVGHVQFAPPSATGDVVRIVGYCLNEDDDIIYFNPDNTFIEVA